MDTFKSKLEGDVQTEIGKEHNIEMKEEHKIEL